MTDEREQERREKALAWLSNPNGGDGYAEDTEWAENHPNLGPTQESLIVGFLGGHRSRDEEVASLEAELRRVRDSYADTVKEYSEALAAKDAEIAALRASVAANKEEWAQRGDFTLLTAADYYYEAKDLREQIVARDAEIERLLPYSEILIEVEGALLANDSTVKAGDVAPMFYSEWIFSLFAKRNAEIERLNRELREASEAIRTAPVRKEDATTTGTIYWGWVWMPAVQAAMKEKP